jgi:hypothetical protein
MDDVLEDRVVAALGERTYPFGLVLRAGDGALAARLALRCGRLIALDAGGAGARLDAVANVDARADAVLPSWTSRGRARRSSASPRTVPSSASSAAARDPAQ